MKTSLLGTECSDAISNLSDFISEYFYELNSVILPILNQSKYIYHHTCQSQHRSSKLQWVQTLRSIFLDILEIVHSDSQPTKLTRCELIQSKREVPRDARNSKVRRQDKFRRDWSRPNITNITLVLISGNKYIHF